LFHTNSSLISNPIVFSFFTLKQTISAYYCEIDP
jgi:hypothetical protein